MQRSLATPLAVALALTLSTAPARAGDDASRCWSGFEIAAPAVATGGSVKRATMTATGDGCAFQVRLCANAGAPGCAARSLRRLSMRGAAVDVAPPESLDDPGSCGAWSTVDVPAQAGRTVRRRLRATARDARGRRHRVRVTLSCAPEISVPPPIDDPGTTGDTRACEGIASRTVGRLIDFPPSSPIESCVDGGTSSNYLTPLEQLNPDAPEEMHVISVYEGALPDGANRGFQEHPKGRIDVTVRARPKPIVLYLGSYEPERWDLHVEPGATLSRILTFGYYDQQVTGVPAGVSVTALDYEDGVSCMYGWELSASQGGCPFRDTMLRIRELTQLTETSFQGCYGGRTFLVPHSESPPAACSVTPVTGDEHVALRDVALPGCESVTQESSHCLTGAGGSLAVVGLDTGTVCSLAGASTLAIDPISPTIAWRGEAVYACLYGAGLVRTSLRDGAIEFGNMPCSAVAIDDAGRLLVSTPVPDPTDPFSMYRTSLLAFDSWADALAGRAAETYPGGGGFGFPERFAVRDGIVYSAWHSTDTIWRTDLATGAALSDLPLDGYDGWILGLSATGDGRLVIPGDTWGDTIRIFDAATGAMERSVTPSVPVNGIACTDAR